MRVIAVDDAAVGWVAHRETQHQASCLLNCALGFALLNPTYESARANVQCETNLPNLVLLRPKSPQQIKAI
jgi:hypothetical protein